VKSLWTAARPGDLAVPGRGVGGGSTWDGRLGPDGVRAALAFLCLVYGLGMSWLALLAVGPALLTPMRAAVVLSGSMEPTIRPGDVVVFAPTDARELDRGQVILFPDPSRPGRLLTHRIDAPLPDGAYRTKGDANASADSTPVRPEDVRGVARLLVPLAGLPVLWLRTGQIMSLVIWVVVTIGLTNGALPRSDTPRG